jgi:threonine/homoserine/homoserine lactone efflux protein
VAAVAAIRWESVGPLLLMSLAIMGSPGPATISLVAAGSVHGVRRSLRYLVGIIAGTAIVLIAVASGVTAALLAVPAIGPVLTWASVAYILWLAYRIATAQPLSVPAAGTGAFTFSGGTLLGAANPKAWVAIAAVFASAHLARPALPDAGAKVALLSAMIVLICVAWLGAGTAIAPLLTDKRRARFVNVALAVMVVGTTSLALLH